MVIQKCLYHSSFICIVICIDLVLCRKCLQKESVMTFKFRTIMKLVHIWVQCTLSEIVRLVIITDFNYYHSVNHCWPWLCMLPQCMCVGKGRHEQLGSKKKSKVPVWFLWANWGFQTTFLIRYGYSVWIMYNYLFSGGNLTFKIIWDQYWVKIICFFLYLDGLVCLQTVMDVWFRLSAMS